MFLPLLIFHGKLLFRIYPHKRSYGGICFTTIFSNLKNSPPKNHVKSKMTLQDGFFCDFH
ncbi:hypothetical protein [Helicobacter pylori]|uniref:hypothetical protein n=1 Tax=Helicobacter pylori TaxID=210 RepID=UPI0011E4D57D|nr:hypothetical protein [Helicobacter pylori]